jgi:2-polyprenyl-3-methyl-5-hydroxy-6-metoxy-1,4-benzoquinol methylase
LKRLKLRHAANAALNLISEMKKILKRIPAAIEGKPIERDEPCRVCNEKIGEQIAVIDYWDIKTSRLIKCSKCNHIQLDPMLTDAETSKGCYAYYIEESLRISEKEQFTNCTRCFRRGVVFGYFLKRKKINPEHVLELGPGTGYFSAGLKFVFPAIEITVMDINIDILNFNREHHNYKTIHNAPDNFIAECVEKFDFVIARDIIEHVSDISKVLKNVYQYLTPGGHFHFITPNGHEDVWKHYLTSILTNSASELLINHVNYYDGKGLKMLLMQEGFKAVGYYTCILKRTLRGNGWKKNKKLMSPVSIKKKADFFIKEKAKEVLNIEFVKENILNKWYIQNKAKWITYLYSLYQHYSVIKLDPELNIGHEIYGLFKKSGSNI